MSSGEVNTNKGKVLLDVVEARMKSIELTDFEKRLSDFEAAAATVDLPGARNMRGV